MFVVWRNHIYNYKPRLLVFAVPEEKLAYEIFPQYIIISSRLDTLIVASSSSTNTLLVPVVTEAFLRHGLNKTRILVVNK